MGALTGNFRGLTSNEPIKKLLNEIVSRKNLKKSLIDYAIGSVNINSGLMEYITYEHPEIMDYIIASTAIPLIMPTSVINSTSYCDGGVRDSAPLKSAIQAGADQIIIIACSPIEVQKREVDTGNIFNLLERLLDIITNETLKNDIEKLKSGNREATKFNVRPKREVRYKLIHPENRLNVSLTKFNSKDIADMIDYGKSVAKKCKWHV